MIEQVRAMDASDSARSASVDARRRAVEAYAAADTGFLVSAWERLGAGVAVEAIRGPEVGLVMLRGRIGGGGAPFNLGEASVTRASVRLDGGAIGHAMVLGRDADKARLAAALDAAWQAGPLRGRIEAEVVAPVIAAREGEERQRREETEATKVDFFTVVRGDD